MNGSNQFFLRQVRSSFCRLNHVEPSFLLVKYMPSLDKFTFLVKVKCAFGWVSPHVSSLIQSWPSSGRNWHLQRQEFEGGRPSWVDRQIEASGRKKQVVGGHLVWFIVDTIFFLAGNRCFFGGNLWFLSFWVVSFLGVLVAFLTVNRQDLSQGRPWAIDSNLRQKVITILL